LSYFNLGICSIAFEPIIEENRHMSHIETEIEKTSKHINDIETKLIKDLCNKIASGKDALSKM
jgi:vacuolar-type H+-ATPase subunit D/Vma8